MTLETFFQKFDQLADAPNAVAKMRELVMWSAFSGAFSSEERDQPMPEEWAVDGAPTLPDIPSSWRWQRGSEVFRVIRGVSYKKNDASDVPVEGSFPVLRANNIGDGINFDDLVYVPKENIRDEQFIRRGDILIAMSSGSKKLVGKAAPVVTEFNGAFGAFCGVIRNKSEMPDDVLARFFQSPQYTSWVTAAGRGIGINNLGRGNLDSLPVPTPPLAEQQRIVAKVDELMALCDRLETQQHEREIRHAALSGASLARFADAPTPANLNFLFHPSYTIDPTDLRKTILTLAVQGKLVPQDPNDEPAEALNVKLPDQLRVIADIVGARFSLPAALVEACDDVPAGWGIAAIQSIGITQTGTTPSKSEASFTGRDIPFIKPGDIQGDEIDYENEGLSADGLSAGRLIPKNSVLMVSIGGSIGKTAIVNRHVSCNQQINSVSPAECIEPRFVLTAIRSGDFQNEVMSRAAQGTLPIISKGKWETIRIPIPPQAEQRRIVAKVDQLMALVDELERQLAASETTAGKFMEAVVSELTTQD